MTKLLGTTQAALDAHGLHYKAIDCDPSLADTAAFCEHYNFSLEQSANAIIVVGKSEAPVFCCFVVNAIAWALLFGFVINKLPKKQNGSSRK